MSDPYELILPARTRNRQAGIWRIVNETLEGTVTLPWPYADRHHVLAEGWAAAIPSAPPTTTQPQSLELFEIKSGKTHEAPIAADRGQLGLAITHGRAFVCGVGPFLISVELASRRGLVRYACEGAPAGAALSSMVADGERLIVVDEGGTDAWVFDLRDARDANPIRHVSIGGPTERRTSHARVSVSGPFVIVRRRVDARTTFIVALDRATLDVVGSVQYRTPVDVDDAVDVPVAPLHEPSALAAFVVNDTLYVVDVHGQAAVHIDDVMRHTSVVANDGGNRFAFHAVHPIPDSSYGVFVRADRKGVGIYDVHLA